MMTLVKQAAGFTIVIVNIGIISNYLILLCDNILNKTQSYYFKSEIITHVLTVLLYKSICVKRPNLLIFKNLYGNYQLIPINYN